MPRQLTATADRQHDDDYRDSPLNALDSFGGSYGDDIDDEQNPYPTPRRNKSSKKKRRMSSAAGLTATQKLFSFEGRINRADYWLYGTVIEALGALVQIIMNVIFFGEAFIAEGAQLPAAYLAFLVLLAVISVWMGLALHAKRLHDRNKSGFMFLVVFIPLIGVIWLLISCYFLPGTPGTNEYGPEPS